MENLLELLNISKTDLKEEGTVLGINTVGILFLLYNLATLLNNIINFIYYDTVIITLNTTLGLIVSLLIFILAQLVRINYRGGAGGSYKSSTDY